MNGPQIHNGRVDWVDYAEGFCIIFVVMMHSTLGVEAAVDTEAGCHSGWRRRSAPCYSRLNKSTTALKAD